MVLMQKRLGKAGSVSGEVILGKYRGRKQPGFVQLLYYNLLRQAPLVIIIMFPAHSLQLN